MHSREGRGHSYISRMAIVRGMHPAERLRGVKSIKLQGKTIVLGVTGSIAAVECVKLAHELIRHGAEVHAVFTRSATEIIHPNALQYATGNPVVTQITGSMDYLEMCGRDGNRTRQDGFRTRGERGPLAGAARDAGPALAPVPDL